MRALRTIAAANALWILLSRPRLPELVAWPREFWKATLPAVEVRYLFFGLPLAVEWLLYGLLALSLAACLAGVLPRAACLTAGVLLYHFAPLETIFWSRLGPYFNGLTFPLLALLILGFAAVPRRGAGASPEFRWPLALAQVLFSFNYFSAAFSKLHTAGLSWISGSNIQGMAATIGTTWSSPPWARWVAERPVLCSAIAVGTMILEMGFILVPFSRVAARILVPAAAIGHVGITLAFGIVFLNIPCLLIYLDWDRIQAWIETRRARGGIDGV
jgi:hypothetical protein